MAECKSTTKSKHLTKDQRLPRSYKNVEKILKDVKANKGTFKSIIYQANLRRPLLPKVYALTLNVLKHLKILQQIIEETGLIIKEPFLRQEIAEILIYELLFGKSSLIGNNKQVLIIKKHQHDIEKKFSKIKSTNGNSFKDCYSLPRYARIHTLNTSVSEVLSQLKNDGFEIVDYDQDISLKKYHKMVRKLKENEFIIDYHFKDLLVFATGINLYHSRLYQQSHIFLQDKASYIPVHVLNPQPKSICLDACAAPGMKTAHLAAVMNNLGMLYAVDRDKKRFETLKTILSYGAVKICKSLCKDFTSIDPNKEPYNSVEYILLDPSCSGSGMINRMDEVTDSINSKIPEHIEKLAKFQIVLLKHALSFPAVKKVVYSTCSIFEEENEYVVHEALNAFNNDFQLAHVLPEWPTRGKENYKFGNLCLRSSPEKNFCNGFFVALFERIENKARKLNKKKRCKNNI